ncbi:Conserved hypothetical protein [Neisseria gonorrhoeae NCCP11945]|uniref:Uncharacterized protein n=1 Tax=Neisseria gonorrhoeae (strain NCCP11945) TaxID=521006 RepID=B4RNS1_NEIG2|nr:Conserved hypothetical protein [Neisseria gonorrhoeae NCCP11945]
MHRFIPRYSAGLSPAISLPNKEQKSAGGSRCPFLYRFPYFLTAGSTGLAGPFGAGAPTEAWSFSFASTAGPMPFTLIKSSTDLNAPFCARYSAMAFAFAGPMPGSASSSCCEAALMFTAAREKAQENSIQNNTNIFFMVFPLRVANNKPHLATIWRINKNRYGVAPPRLKGNDSLR